MSNWSLCTFASLGKETLTKTGRLTLKNFFMGFLTWWGTMMKKVTILHINLMIQWRPQQKNCLLSLTKMVMGIDQRYISHINNVLWMIYSIIYLYWNFLSQILVRCGTTTCNWKTSPVRELLCETTSRLHHITGIQLKPVSYLIDEKCIYLYLLSHFDMQIESSTQ